MISQVAKDLKNKTFLLNASAGGAGSLLVQLSRFNGAKVTATINSDKKLKVAKEN